MSAMSYPHHTENPTDQIIGQLATRLGRYPLAVEDSEQSGQRAKLQIYGNVAMMVGFGLVLQAGVVVMRQRGNRQRLLEPEMATQPRAGPEPDQPGVTPSDRKGPGERATNRRSARQPGRQYDRLCRARTGRSVAPAVWARRVLPPLLAGGRELELTVGQQLAASHHPHPLISGTR